MRNILLILAMLMLSPLCGKQHLLLKLNADYTWGDGNADFVKIKMLYYRSGKIEAQDSFVLKGPLKTEWRRTFDVMPDSMVFRIVDHTKRIPWQKMFVRFDQLQHCQSLRFENLMKKGKCDSFPMNELGTVCAALDIAVFDDAASQMPLRSGFQQNDIFCESEAVNYRLSAPCYMNYRPAESVLQWYESSGAQGPWTKTDTGRMFSPFSWMQRNQMPLFNQQRYYKVVLDSFTITGEKDKATEVYGPVRYFVNANSKSISVYGSRCSETEKRIDISLINDSFHQHASGVNVWSKNLTDTVGGLWFLGNKKNVTGISIGEAVGQYHALALRNSGKPFHLVNGMYAVGLDFTPWNDFDCGFRWDTVQVSGPYGIEINPRIICGESCPGNSDGKITITGKSALWNDTILVGVKGVGLYKPGDTITVLPRGDYDYAVSGRGGCVVTGKITIPGSPFFGKKFGVDTTLCLGQKLIINAKDPNATAFEAIQPNGIKLLSDTFTASENGQWLLKWTNDSGCVARDTLHIQRRNLSVIHDFLMPAQIKLPDTAWAIDHSRPKPLSSSWISGNATWTRAQKDFLQFLMKDTGHFPVTLVSRFDSGCTFRRTKILHMIQASDTAAFIPQMGYQGPLIRRFVLKPNPSNGMQYQADISLRKPADITFALLDPISGAVLRKSEFKNVQFLAERPFDIATEGIYYIRVIAGNEIQTRKILIVK